MISFPESLDLPRYPSGGAGWHGWRRILHLALPFTFEIDSMTLSKDLSKMS